jgi:sigma-B regulation protein RsbU (phosphoserine phosphatase)
VLSAAANAVAVKLRNRSLEEALRIAAGIQRSMLPSELSSTPGYEMAALQEMCLAVGGDLYHCLPRPAGTLLLVLGDISGKGMPAALAMATAMGLIGILAEIGGELRALTEQLHKQLLRSLLQRQFLTVFLGELEPATGRITYVNHGQDRPVLVRAGGELEMLQPTGLPIAMFEQLDVQPLEARLGSGDLLAVFSDGIAEATVDGSEFYGIERLHAILQEHRTEPLGSLRQRVEDDVRAFLRGGASSDDMTLLLVRRTASDDASPLMPRDTA